ncbi:unnamed protein product [Oppiella nova]|uniref:Uncharacterized protein n=1 Tax=Oppiella nova TaxID=334625 RepID=A0A7R9QGM3_9ACAR|nr:unnamed protein product [Oppiella nova]CAG2164977.1 unnamed protein product [Oppiella nova]
MHALMLLILIGAIVLAQIGLIYWRKRSFKTYQNVSMIGMWFVPFALSLYNHWFRFVSIWLAITLVTSALISKPLFNKQLTAGSIPRLIYKWFYLLYSLSSIVAVSGYLLIMATLLGINLLLGVKPNVPLDFGFLLLFYGIYYGVLTRDFTDFLVDLLAANIGYYQPSSSLPSKQLKSSVCAICGRTHNESTDEKTYTLTYHPFFVQTGKTALFQLELFEKRRDGKVFGVIDMPLDLDFIRYLIAWQPVIIFAVQCFNYMLGLE